MKKFIQYTAVLGAVLTVLGFGTASAAHVQGGRWTKMYIWEDLVIHPHRDKVSISIPFNADQGTVVDENSRSFPCLPELSLEVEFADVTISLADTDRIIIQCGSSSDFKQVVWAYAEDSEVRLFAFGKHREGRKPEITVFVPKNYTFQEFDIEMGEGNCKVEGIKALELSGNTASGTLFIEEGEVSQAEFSCAAGSITYHGQVLEEIDMDCAAGNILYNGVILGDVEANCAAGNIFLEITEQQENDFNYEIEGTGGNIHVGETFYSGVLFDKDIHYGAPRTMGLHCAAGSIEVVFAALESFEIEVEKNWSEEVDVGYTWDEQEISCEEDHVEEAEETKIRRER